MRQSYSTFNMTFPVTSGMPADPGVNLYKQDGFVTEISAAGDHIIYSGLIVGSKVPCPQSFCGIDPYRDVEHRSISSW
jgi:hypothetical protein